MCVYVYVECFGGLDAILGGLEASSVLWLPTAARYCCGKECGAANEDGIRIPLGGLNYCTSLSLSLSLSLACGHWSCPLSFSCAQCLLAGLFELLDTHTGIIFPCLCSNCVCRLSV